ncbi:conserved protein, unknown function, partial [Hepatocystis sp. ex Piliocolobus tephrosceles]
NNNSYNNNNSNNNNNDNCTLNKCLYYKSEQHNSTGNFQKNMHLFYGISVIVKSVYEHNNTVYEYPLNKAFNIIVKKKKNNKILTFFLNNAIFNILPQHINFFYYMYSLYFVHYIEKKSYTFRNFLRKKIKRKDYYTCGTENEFFFVNIILNVCSFNLFCIDPNFDINNYVDNEYIVTKMASSSHHIHKNNVLNEGITKLLISDQKKTITPHLLLPINFSLNMKYVIKISNQINVNKEKEIKKNIPNEHYIFLSNTKVCFNDYTNVLKNILTFEEEKKKNRNNKNKQNESNSKTISPYDIILTIIDKQMHIHIIKKAKIIFFNFFIYQLYLAIRKIIYIEHIQLSSKKNIRKKFKTEKKKKKHNFYHLLLKNMEEKLQSGYNSKNNYTNVCYDTYSSNVNFCNNNNFKYKIKSIYNNINRLKHLIRLDIYTGITFVIIPANSCSSTSGCT